MVSANHHKIRPASMIHPNPALVRPPAIAFGARGIAMLCYQPHLGVSRFHAAGMPSHIVGVARNRLRISVVVPVSVVIAILMIHVAIRPALILKNGIAPNRKVRAASMVHPDSQSIGAPAVTFRASRFAMLRQQSHAASRIK